MTDNRRNIDKKLDLWLREQPSDFFPNTGEADYINRYDRVSGFLQENVHREIERQAILEEISRGTVDYDQIIYLNNHGPGHVNQVIERMSDLLSENGLCEITPYEAYLLLMAINFHDVGNVFGRENHEIKSARIMRELGLLAGNDMPEKRVILMIAAAHGGNLNGDKDIIGRLQPKTDLLGQPVRKQFLAALLRFSDELADDRTRASRFFLGTGRIPAGSELYHSYSACLHSVVVGGSEVRLVYEFDKKTALKKFRKGSGDIFLFDEILERTLKMHMERCYCMRFLRPESVRVERIQVTVNVCNPFDSNRPTEYPKRITFCLEEKGYPSRPLDGIVALCPSLKDVNGQSLSDELSSGGK